MDVDGFEKELVLLQRGRRWRVAKTTALLFAPTIAVAIVGLMLPIPPVACVLAIIGTGNLTCAIVRRKLRLR